VNFAAALKMCQSVKFDNHFQQYKLFLRYSGELRLCINRMESELTHRMLQRNQAFPTVCFADISPLNFPRVWAWKLHNKSTLFAVS